MNFNMKLHLSGSDIQSGKSLVHVVFMFWLSSIFEGLGGKRA